MHISVLLFVLSGRVLILIPASRDDCSCTNVQVECNLPLFLIATTSLSPALIPPFFLCFLIAMFDV